MKKKTVVASTLTISTLTAGLTLVLSLIHILSTFVEIVLFVLLNNHNKLQKESSMIGFFYFVLQVFHKNHLIAVFHNNILIQ